MRAWRLTPTRHADTAFTGTGAALYGGRWNPQGKAVVYLSSSLALATLEVVVHAAGALMAHTAIEVEVSEVHVQRLDSALLATGWSNDELFTQRVGADWLAGDAGLTTALVVPSVLIDTRAESEWNMLVAPTGPAARSLVEVQRFDVMIDVRRH